MSPASVAAVLALGLALPIPGQDALPESVRESALNAIRSELGQAFRGQEGPTTKPATGPFRLVSIDAGGEAIWPLSVPRARLPERAVLPDGAVGNQFLVFRFTGPVDVDRVLRSGAIQVLEYDPTTEQHRVVKGRWVVGGVTSVPEHPERTLRIVEEEGDGLAVVSPRGDGFPMGFGGDGVLAKPSSAVFIPDPDGDLRTPDAFPTDVLIWIIVTDEVRGARGQPLENEIAFATTRGG